MLREGRERVLEERKAVRGQRRGLLAELRTGEAVVVNSLDGFGGSVGEIVRWVESLRRRGVGIRSLCESLDSASSESDGMFRAFKMLGEAGRALQWERVQWRLKAVNLRGKRRGGRRRLGAARRARSGPVPVAPALGDGDRALRDASRSMLYT